MLRNLFLKFGRSTLFAALGQVLAALGAGLAGWSVTGDDATRWVFAAVAAALTGALAALARLIGWDPNKAARR